MKAELIAIGNEVTSGDIADTNSAWLARKLREVGVEVDRIGVVGDRLELIQEVLREASSRAPVVIATGGLGPTFDDLTRKAAAAFAGVELERNRDAVRHLESWFRNRGRPMPRENLCQAEIPSGAEMLGNTRGTAPGFSIQVKGSGSEGGSHLFFLPGVPQEMRAMYRDEVLPRLRQIFPDGSFLRHFKIHLFGIWESEANQRLRQEFTPGEMGHLGIRASGGIITVKAYLDDPSGSGSSPLPARLQALFRDVAIGEGEETLESALIQACNARGATLSVAESCTGGLIASRITSIPGASSAFSQGWVVYSDAAKVNLLGVPRELLRTHGAVSEPVARALAVGALERSGSDVAVSVTGIAGPSGGTSDKPVGLVWFGAAVRKEGSARNILSFSRRIKGSRSRVQLFSANTALDLARRALVSPHPESLFRT